MDSCPFRELYGFMSDDKLARSSAARRVRRQGDQPENAENELFGAALPSRRRPSLKVGWRRRSAQQGAPRRRDATPA